MFDDAPNLSYLGAYGGVVDWASFKSFAFGGIAGPSGRPVALMTFLLDDNTWPSEGSWFKQTNLLFHLLTGIVLCWATLLLMRLFGKDERQAVWIAVINMGLWLLHPYLVSTTLYVVQRMAQLAALFMLSGLAGYLYGRLLLSKKVISGYLWMSISLILGTSLAFLSKENGILLPLLVFIIEYCKSAIEGKNISRLDWRWQLLFLWVPSIAVVVILLRYVDFSPDAWPARSFSQPERLMTEGRILWEYLYHLWIPRIEGRGLFQDGYIVSRGWFSPPSTILASLGLILLIGSAILLRRRWPLFSLSVLFFFGSHLIESTVIGLELYFEHRNYIASAFLFLPLAQGLLNLNKYIRPIVAGLIIGLMFIFLSALTWQRATLWADTQKLEYYWAVSNRNSARAQNFLAARLFNQGRPEEAVLFLEKASERLPESSLLTMQLLMHRVIENAANHDDFLNAFQKLKFQRFDAQTIMGLRTITEYIIEKDKKPEYRQWVLDLIMEMAAFDQYKKVPLFVRLSFYLRGLIYTSQGKIEDAMPVFLKSLDYYNDTDVGLSIVADLAREGYPAQALSILRVTEDIYRKQPDRTLKRPREVYDFEIKRLERNLYDDLGMAGYLL